MTECMKMVSAAYHSGTAKSAKKTNKSPRKMKLDPRKDYSKPLQVETSVEYDLPAHIYPPKGAGPILMVAPQSVPLPSKSKPQALTSMAPPTPLHPILTENTIPQRREDPKTFPTMSCIECRNGQCSQSKGLKNIPMAYNRMQNFQQVSDLKKRIQQVNLVERIAQTQKEQQQCSTKSATEQLFPWAVSHLSQAAPQPFPGVLQPCLPTTVFGRNTSRGSAGGSPKLRARTRRGLMANPDYLALTRPSRSAGCTSVLQNQHRPRTFHGTSELDLFKSCASSQTFLDPSCSYNQPPGCVMSTVGQSIDSGCSMGSDLVVPSANGIPLYYTPKDTFVVPSIDSGFCTPVDLSDEGVMDCMDKYQTVTPSSSLLRTPINVRDAWPSQSNLLMSQTNLPTYYQAPAPLFNLAY